MTTASTHAEIGMNRTGIGTSPLLSEEMVAGTDELQPATDSDDRAIGLARGDYAREADPIGSMPPPLSIKGALKTACQALNGDSPTQFIDMLGARTRDRDAGAARDGETDEIVTVVRDALQKSAHDHQRHGLLGALRPRGHAR